MEIKFDVYFKKNLGTLCKDNEVDLDGKEANVNIDLNLVDKLEVNYSVGGTEYTDEITIKDINNKEILIPFKSDVVKKGLNEFEVVAYMKNGDIKVSQTYTYNIEKGIGEGQQVNNSGSSHSHSNLSVLNTITQTKINEWNNKADASHEHSDYASNIHTHNVNEIEGLENIDIDLSDYATKNYVDDEISKIELKEGPKGDKGEQGPQGVKGDTPSITHLETTVSNKVNEIETRFNTLTSKQQQDAEVIDARNGESSLGIRLNKFDSQLEHNINELSEKIDEVANTGTTVEVLKSVTKQEIEKRIQDGTIANLTIEDNSITNEKYQDGSITQEKIHPDVKLGNDIVDNLESERSDAVLSARQGAILNNKTISMDKSILELQELVASQQYDTIIQLPYSATTGTNVMLKFSPLDNITTLINQVSNRTFGDTSGWIDKDYSSAYNNHSIETIEFDGKKCLKLTYNHAAGYHDVQSINPYNKVWDSTHQYFIYANIYIESKQNTSYPSVGLPANLSYNKNLIGEWQEVYGIFTVPSYNKNSVIWRIMNDGIMYLSNPILLDLTELELTSKSVDELVEIIKTSNFKGEETLQYSCYINNGEDIKELPPFLSSGNTQFLYIEQGNILSISNREGYMTPFIEAKANSSDNVNVIENAITKTRFYGKKVNFEGDSITQSDYLDSYNNKSWADYLSEKLGFSVVRNYAIGGSSISNYNTAGSVVNRIKSDSFDTDCDLVFVFAGTNDWNSNVPLGDIDSTDESTILGALNVIIDTLQTKCVNATIVVMTPMHRSGTRTATREAGTMMELAKAYEEVCERWGVDCINTLKTFGINAYNTTNQELYLPDKLHPSVEGHKRIANRMVGIVSTI